MLTRFIAAVAVSGALAFAPSAFAQAQSPPTPEPSELLGKIHHTNQVEMQMGQLALEKGGTAEVRRYGELLYRDHRMADGMVTKFAHQRSITLAAPMPKSPDEQKQMEQQMDVMNKLKTTSGAEFDRTFLMAMEKGHEKAIGMLDAAEPNVQDSDLRGMLGKMLPVLRQHLALAKNLQSKEAQS